MTTSIFQATEAINRAESLKGVYLPNCHCFIVEFTDNHISIYCNPISKLSLAYYVDQNVKHEALAEIADITPFDHNLNSVYPS